MFNIKIKDVGDTSNIFMFTCSNFHEMSFFFELYNAQLSSPKRTGSLSALLGNTKPNANQNRRALRVCLNCLLCEFKRISQVG
ncbi:hypothetical protein CGJ87_24055 [Vibrio parahaemolyticus]|nr:hypothetical protein [Vibrio parahaemolyticus]TOC26342.1 hypothetical protein CGJ87_24055 [Vibrio parahaemolyticus]TOD02380.1 hypothetical protein CGJ71_23670 [Vibrio parahaemolyticus]TOD07582.1 hypothetical protein CGJ73_22680 [Vibrio parahaemolyticus]TOD08531.1 hypothetical protein CGJ70_22780 [Vibrio parahaemolyticus]